MYICSYIQKESVQTESLIGLKNGRNWDPFSQKQIGFRVCLETTKTSLNTRQRALFGIYWRNQYAVHIDPLVDISKDKMSYLEAW